MQTKINELANLTRCKFLANEALAKHTTWHVGGPADALFMPQSVEECIEVLNAATLQNIPFFILGNGSNLLVGDKGFRGIVIKTSALKNITFTRDSVSAECGVKLPLLAMESAKRSLSGLEFAAGIPGTIGGVVKMNAGAEGSSIANVFKKALCWGNGKVFETTYSDMDFSYRSSIIKRNPMMVLQVEFNLSFANNEEIKTRINQYVTARKTKQPLEYPNAGSVFKNPPGNFAGKLINEAGLKGKSIGGAIVSPKHANFIVNTGNATAMDIKNLINTIQLEVARSCGVNLETEVEFVGEF